MNRGKDRARIAEGGRILIADEFAPGRAGHVQIEIGLNLAKRNHVVFDAEFLRVGGAPQCLKQILCEHAVAGGFIPTRHLVAPGGGEHGHSGALVRQLLGDPKS